MTNSLTIFLNSLILIALAVFFIAGIIYALIKSSITLISSYNVNNPFKTLDFSRGFVFSNVTNFIKNYYSNIFSAIGMLWSENISLIGTNFSQSGMYRYFNPIKYFYLTSPAGIMIVTLLFIQLILMLMIK